MREERFDLTNAVNDSVERRTRVRRCFAVGFDGATVDDAPLDALRAFAPGTIVLFARNVGTLEALRELIAALRGISDPPPLIAIDQEGGRVARIGEPFLAMPAAMALGAVADAALTERLATVLGRDLARLGISVDFAPVADLALDAANTVIGSRSFGSAPHQVARQVTAFARGLARGGVAAAIKHFPGHGGTAGDSHRTLPHITADAATLQTRDFVPFAAVLSSEGAELVMTAHVVIDAFDAALPATLSPRILEGLLREQFGFDGVIVTDCLEMDAIANTAGTVDGARAAFAAGADLLLVSHHLDLANAAADAIDTALGDGSIPERRLDEAVARVDALRARYAVPAPVTSELRDETRSAAARAVTVVRGTARLRDGLPVTVMSFEGATYDGAGGVRAAAPASLSAALRARRWKSELMRVPLAPDDDDLDLLLSHLPSLGDRNFVIVVRRAHLFAEQRRAVERIVEVVPDALIVSAREPYDVALWPAARNVVAIYADEVLAFEGCADVLSGIADAGGTLPVDLS